MARHTNLFKYLIVFPTPPLFHLAGPWLNRLPPPPVPLGEQGEGVNPSLLLQAGELLGQVVQRVTQALSFNAGQSCVNAQLLKYCVSQVLRNRSKYIILDTESL